MRVWRVHLSRPVRTDKTDVVRAREAKMTQFYARVSR